MNRKFKVMAISAVAALIFALPLAAQSVETNFAGGPTSNLRQATAELYKTDVDNFSNVNNWSSVKFGSWFGFLHGINITNGAQTQIGTGYSDSLNRGNLGFATNLGGIYLGLRYYGNIFQDTGGDERVTLTPAYDPITQQLSQLTETTTYPTTKWHNSTNQLDVLIGVAGQGIKVGFFESMAVRPTEANRTFTKIDYQNGNVSYSGETIEYTEFGGYLRPSVQWGTVLDLSGMTLKPRAGVSFNIFQDKLIEDYYANYTAYNGTPTEPRTVTRTGRNYGYLQTGITAGADLTLPNKNDLATTFTLDYTVGFNSYNNDYSASGFDGEAKGLVNWSNASTATRTSIAEKRTVTTATLAFNDVGYSYHSIAPRVTLDKTVSDSLKIGLAVLAPISITSTSNDRYREVKTYTTVNNYDATNSADAKTVIEQTEHTPLGLTETTRFGIAPSVRIGASYKLIPDRFTVNAGVRLDPFVWINTTTTQSRNGDGFRTTGTTKNGDGVVIGKTDTTVLLGAGGTYTDFSTVESTWSAFTGSVGLGFLFNFNENVALDFFANSGNLATNWTPNLATVNVMFTFKFGGKADGNRVNVQSTNVTAQEEIF